MSTTNRVLELIKEQGSLGEFPASMANLVDDLGFDSLDQVEIIVGFEEAFDIEISDNQAETLQTVKDCIEFIDNALNGA